MKIILPIAFSEGYVVMSIFDTLLNSVRCNCPILFISNQSTLFYDIATFAVIYAITINDVNNHFEPFFSMKKRYFFIIISLLLLLGLNKLNAQIKMGYNPNSIDQAHYWSWRVQIRASYGHVYQKFREIISFSHLKV